MKTNNKPSEKEKNSKSKNIFEWKTIAIIVLAVLVAFSFYKIKILQKEDDLLNKLETTLKTQNKELEKELASLKNELKLKDQENQKLKINSEIDFQQKIDDYQKKKIQSY